MKLMRIGFTFDTYPELLVSESLLCNGLTTNAVSSPLNKYTYSPIESSNFHVTGALQ